MVDVDTDANVLTNSRKSCVKDVTDQGDDWDFEGAIKLDEVERVGVRRRF